MLWRERVKQAILIGLAENFPMIDLHLREAIADDVADYLPSPDERNGYVIVPSEPTEDMITAGLVPTVSWQDIKGSRLTVNREKMRLRYKAMIEAVTKR
jgi:hypothetical protein